MVKQVMDQAAHRRITAAVTAAEHGTSGEIVVVSAELSDSYHDVGLHYAIGAMFLKLGAIWAMGPERLHRWMVWLWGWNGPEGHYQMLGMLFCILVLTFLIVRYAMAWMPLRLALTPRATRQRRVRRRAVMLFNAMAQGRTAGRTGVLLYLSQGEHMAEIVADEAIHTRVPDSIWGEAMLSLIDQIRDGRMVDGMVSAIEQIGVVLAAELPIEAGDRNELPDRMIEL